MKFFNGEKCEVVLKPSDAQIENAMTLSRKFMAEKMDHWILDQLTIEQLKNCIIQFGLEIQRRNDREKTKTFKIGDHRIEVKPPTGGEE